MRAWAALALLIVAACDSAPAEKAAEPVATAAAPEPGEWEFAAEVTAFNKADSGKPRIDTPKGTRSTEKYCLASGEKIPTDFFSGAGYTCSYGNYYVRNGGINVTLSCINKKMNEAVLMAADGSFEGGSVTFDRNLRSAFSTDGDVVIDSHITGKRIGDCTPAGKAGKAASK